MKGEYSKSVAEVQCRPSIDGITDGVETLSNAADIVAWHAESQDFDLGAVYRDQDLRRVFLHLVNTGKTLILAGQSAVLAARCSVPKRTASHNHPRFVPGWNLIPDSALVVDYNGQPDRRAQLMSLLASQQKLVGIGLSPHTALMLSGRKVTVAGSGLATLHLMADEFNPLRIESIQQQTSRRQRPREWMMDWTEWRRDAIDRTLERFPPLQPKPPFVEHGTLFIVGGGGLPNGLMDEFIEAAGGAEQARLVYVPCSEEEDVAPRQSMVENWKKMGVQQATFIHTKDRRLANEDAEFLAPLRTATGIWFGGGRQWNFADSYYGTTAHRLMKEVLWRGGAIGGSSAGASIQARYLARATPIENFRIMAPGYERGGLGFLSGVAIDQHFSQRGRQRDMTALVDRYPQLLGIGIDERTALIVQQSTGRIVGEGQVHFYDRRRPVFPNQPDFIALQDGESFDLIERQPVASGAPEEAALSEETLDR